MTLEQLSAIIGLLLPIFINVLLKATWAPWVKRTVVYALSLAIGIATTAISHGIAIDNVDTLIQSTLVIIGASQVAYTAFFKPTGIAENIEKNISLPLLR
jgi:hypothetical protein